MNRLFIYILFKITRLFPGQTLLSLSWNRIKNSSPEVYRLKRERQVYYVSRGINTPKGAFIGIFIGLILLSFSCRFSWDFTGTLLAPFNLIKLTDVGAKQLISDSLMATATISAVSSIVITFLFETVREKTHQTYENLFRATKLYYVLSFVLNGLLMLIVMNLLKHTPSERILFNMAIWSAYLAAGVVGGIIYLFFQVLNYFNPERLASLTKGYLLQAAKFQRLDERLVEECNWVFRNIFESKNFAQSDFFMSYDADLLVRSLGNKNEGFLVDLHVPIVNLLLNSLNAQRPPGTNCYYLFSPYLSYIDSHHHLFSIHRDVKPGKVVSWLSSYSLLLRPVKRTDGSFESEKLKMTNSLNKAAQHGDLDALRKQLSDIEDLYETYYNTK